MPLDQSQRPLYEVKAAMFKGLAHPVRIRILEMLSTSPEVSVTELREETELEQAHLSQHLAVLRNHRLVASERRGSHVYYRLADLLSAARALLLGMLSRDGEDAAERLAEAKALPTIGSAR
jgi:ArsR family transcriptional regulator